MVLIQEKGTQQPLTDEQIKTLLKIVPTWQIIEEKLWNDYDFPDFKQTMAFANKIAQLAEKENHHPTITISQNKVEVEIFTHSSNNLSEKDFSLAEKIDALK